MIGDFLKLVFPDPEIRKNIKRAATTGLAFFALDFIAHDEVRKRISRPDPIDVDSLQPDDQPRICTACDHEGYIGADGLCNPCRDEE